MRFPRFSRRDRFVALGSLVLAGGAAGLIALVFVSAGGVDVAANRPHSWLTYQALHYAFNRSVATRSSNVEPPADLHSASRAALGLQHFHLVCSNCHGGPGLGQSPVALSMTPRPQHLPAVVGQFSDAELFWIVKHGVKFSAMPSWTNQSRDDEVWSMVAFLRELPKLGADDYLKAAVQRPAAAPPPRIAIGEVGRLHDADPNRNTYPKNEHLYAAPAITFGDKTILGNALGVCSRCHDADGTGQATGGEAPNLTIQSAEYLEATLRAYVAGRRVSGFMEPVASEMSDSQISAVTDYFAAQPPKSAAQEPGDPALIEEGRKLAAEGFPGHAVPGCVTCHESAGAKIVAAPNLSGQSPTYLRRQLTVMRDGNRGSTRYWNPMPAVARYLSDENIDALAAYYASRPPLDRAAPAPTEELAAAPAAGLPGDASKGQKMFGEICAKCHTADARGDEEGDFPNLTVETVPYVALALHAYKTGERRNEKMQLVTAQLDDGAIASLAAYVGGLAPKPARAAPDAEAAKRGDTIATKGLPERGLPACLTCHSAEGTGAIPLIARLQGENVNYLRNKLDYFAGPLARDISLLNPMPAIAAQLTKDEQADVAAYFAAQPALEKPAR